MATAQQMPLASSGSHYPLKDIRNPHDHDVLCGRGGGTNNHIGNSHWRMLVAANKQLYITLPKRQKMLLSRSIVNAVRSQNPPGRFLQKDGKTRLWFDVGDQRAQEKTSQALREGAPDIRKKVAAANAVVVAAGTSSAADPTPSSSALSKPKKESSCQENDKTADRSIILPPPQMGQPPNSNGLMPPPAHHYPTQPQQSMNGMYVAPTHNVIGHMTLNERGMMVQQAMQMMGSSRNGYQHPQAFADQQPFHHFGSQQQPQNVGYHQQPMHVPLQQQQQYYNEDNHNQGQHHSIPTPTFDEVVAAPPEELETNGLSFGSLTISDAEMQRLQQINANAMSGNRSSSNRQHSISRDFNPATSNDIPAAPMGGVLEPTGISIGDVSMMSAGTNLTSLQMKLDEGGTSFGTAMSYNLLNNGSNNNSLNNANHPEMVDGGLMDAVGTSFGSLSLDAKNRETLFQTLEIAAGGPEVPPMFRSETKSSANLLECSDTESESSQDKERLTKQKSQAWEMMKTQLEKQTSKSAESVGSKELMPPPPQQTEVHHQTKTTTNAPPPTFENLEIALPPTTMEANFSTLSAWSAAEETTDAKKDDDDDAPAPPPPQLTKTDSF